MIRSIYFRKLIAIIIIFLGYAISVHAETGWCSTNGGTNNFNANFTYNYTKNGNGQANTIPNAYSWNIGGTYPVTCDCTGGSTSFFKSTPGSLTEVLYTDAQNTFYKFNEYLGVATSIFLGGALQQYKPVPFEDINTNTAVACTSSMYSTGSSGQLSLYFPKAFIGKITIPSTIVANLYASRTKSSYPSQPIARVIISGTITVPQTCKINDGQIINIDYGKIMASAMKTKGAAPKGFTAVTTQVAYVCTNINSGVKIAFTFTGESSATDPQSLKTSNEDTGIRIEDMNSQVISPNTGKLATQFDYATQKGSASFKSYPVNVTGNTPTPGVFNASATITTAIE
ncbi:fimbrial protein [Enterobacter asburiae]|nr:fimbrial protein [Enterobacter asburiae]